MARTAKHVPSLDPKFIRERNPDGNWIVADFDKEISWLNKIASGLPEKLPWHSRTVEELKADHKKVVEKYCLNEHLSFDAYYRLLWKDLLEQVQAFGFLSTLRLVDLVSTAVWAIRRNDPLCAAIIARSALETSASYLRFQLRISRVLTLQSAHGRGISPSRPVCWS